MLKLLRPYVKPKGKLVFSLFVDELTEREHGLIDGIHRQIKEKGRVASEKEGNTEYPPPPFLDLDPKKPLKYAAYSRDYALEVMKVTGWNIDSFNDPEEHIQHYIICSPA